jgi:5-formyltetrahydrofolate cyclo-ligase
VNDRPSHRLKQDKRALRRAVLAERDALSGTERAARSEAIVDRLLGLDEAAGAGAVLAFWSFGSEVDTAPLLDRLRSRGTTVALPRTRDGDIVPVIWTPGSSMTETSFGSREPADGRVLEARELDLIVVPGVAFDRSCGRVGYGGGFYDRLLARTRDGAAAAAIAFGVQVVDQVPAGPLDRPVDAIVTEDDVIRCR